MNSEILVLFMLSSLTLTLMPGPDILLVFSMSMTRGWKKGLVLSLGLTSGIFIHTTVVILGIGALLQAQPNAMRFIQWIGAAYLIYLGIQIWMMKPKENKRVESPNKDRFHPFITGFIMNITNPKVSLFFISFFPGFLFHDSWSYGLQFLILGILFFIQALLVFSLVSLTADRMGKNKKANSDNVIWNRLQSLIFFAIAFYLILS